MIHRLRIALCIVITLALQPAVAQEFPVQIDRHVNDFAEVLSPQDEADLRARLEALEAATDVQAVIATVRRRSDYGAPLTVEAWSTALFNAWGIGDAGRDDGILILVGIEDREMRLALGSGYGPDFDLAAQRVIDNAIVPAFREKAYAMGLSAGIDALGPRVIEPFLAGDSPLPANDTAPEESLWAPLAILVAGVTVVVGLNSWKRVGDVLMRFRSCPSCGQRRLRRTRAVSLPATIHVAGLETQLTTCSACSYRSERQVTLAKKGSASRSKSGSSRGGGGRSSGGGASGRW